MCQRYLNKLEELEAEKKQLEATLEAELIKGKNTANKYEKKIYHLNVVTKRCHNALEKQKEAELKCNKLKAALKDCLHSLNEETAKILQANARASALVDEVS